MLHTRAVDRDVFLTRQLLNCSHDLLSYPPMHANIARVRILRKGDGLTHDDEGAPNPRDAEQATHGLRAHHSHWKDGNIVIQRHSRHPGVASIQPAVGRPGALRIDRDEVAFRQYIRDGLQRRGARASAPALHRDHLDELQKPGDDLARQVLAVKQLSLCRECDHAGHHCRQHDGIHRVYMVAGEDCAATSGHVAHSHNLRFEAPTHEGAEHGVLKKLIGQHVAPLVRDDCSVGRPHELACGVRAQIRSVREPDVHPSAAWSEGLSR